MPKTKTRPSQVRGKNARSRKASAEPMTEMFKQHGDKLEKEVPSTPARRSRIGGKRGK